MTDGPRLEGVHHTARPTWKLAETVRFYRDVMGLELVHAISARGWGPADHADFLHFFFDSGQGSTIAFFYYIGTEPPDYAVAREDYQYRATHTAWQVRSREQLLAWRQRMEAAGVKIRYQIQHEVIESIYFVDPNGYSIEITWQMRPFGPIDSSDAGRTLEAAMQLEAQAPGTEPLRSIDQVWRRKGEMIVADTERRGMISVFVLDVDEFRPIVSVARADDAIRVLPPNRLGYWCLQAERELRLTRKALGFKPAVWHGILTGGFIGRIVRFDNDELVIAAPGAG